MVMAFLLVSVVSSAWCHEVTDRWTPFFGPQWTTVQIGGGQNSRSNNRSCRDVAWNSNTNCGAGGTACGRTHAYTTETWQQCQALCRHRMEPPCSHWVFGLTKNTQWTNYCTLITEDKDTYRNPDSNTITGTCGDGFIRRWGRTLEDHGEHIEGSGDTQQPIG